MLDDEERWLTYAEVGELLGISVEAARALARRQNWPRRTPNEHNALARVLVPSDRPAARSRSPGARGMNGGHLGNDRSAENRQTAEHDRSGESADIFWSTVRALESAVETLREQLGIANQRVDEERGRSQQAEQRADEERERAERALARVEELTAQLAERTAAPPPVRRWWRWGGRG
jgi:hypothetical protein